MSEDQTTKLSDRVSMFTQANGDVVVRHALNSQLLGVVSKVRAAPTRYKVLGEDTYGATVAELAERLINRAEGKAKGKAKAVAG